MRCGDPNCDGFCLECGGMTPALPDELVEALKELSAEDAAAAEATYRGATPEEREEMLAFLRTGREPLRQIKLRHEDGIPTDADLARWLDGNP